MGKWRFFKIPVCVKYQQNDTNSYKDFSLITFNVLSINSLGLETKQGIQSRKCKSVYTFLKSK